MAHDDTDKDAEWDTLRMELMDTLAVSELPDTSMTCATLRALLDILSINMTRRREAKALIASSLKAFGKYRRNQIRSMMTAAKGTAMTRNTALRLAALVLTTLVLLPATGDPEFGIGGLFILWGLVTVLLSVLFVALWGTGRGRPSGADLK